MFFVIRGRSIGYVLLMGLILWGSFQLMPTEEAWLTTGSVRASAWEIVVDPGHGGEDGGAVSPDGVAESHINLAIARSVRDLFHLASQPVRMTREEDCSLGGDGTTVRQRKTADLKKRVALVEETPSALLLSIHQNSLPSSPVTHGAQVFWNPRPGADTLAQEVQEDLNAVINRGNEKHTRQIPSSVYLMDHITAPGILVECGFLSNGEETRLLQEPDYQQKLAVTIAAGVLRWTAGEEGP